MPVYLSFLDRLRHLARLDLVLRWLHHLTLALASLCLLVGLQSFLPEAMLYLCPIPLLILGCALLPQGWSLSSRLANSAGAVAVVAALPWLKSHLTGPDSMVHLPGFPAIMVPHAAALLMTLALFCIMRARRRQDFWHLQGLGLVLVAVSCVLASAPIFGPLLFAYLVSALACLTANYQVGEADLATSGQTLTLASGTFNLPSLATMGSAGAVAGAAIFLTWLTPRPSELVWDPKMRFGGRYGAVEVQAQTGYVEGIDLRQTGAIELNDEVAFTVKAADVQGNPRDLPGEQRWRGSTLERYEDGKWRSDRWGTFTRRPFARASNNLPQMGPDQFFVTFRVEIEKAGGLFLAEPVRRGPRSELPVTNDFSGSSSDPLFDYYMDTIVPHPEMGQSTFLYKQVVVPLLDRDRIELPQHRADGLVSYLGGLARRYPEALVPWSKLVFERLVKDKALGLTREDLEAKPIALGRLLISPAGEKIAQALCKYLTSSGEYAYTLDLKRDNPKIDPVLDFLVNVKQGHCERFAAALALVLRTRGIPTRLVKGFRGCDALGNGKYAVRQRHAHTWVEAAVLPRRQPPEDAPEYLEWLVLDPTPNSDVVAVEAPSALENFVDRIRNYEELWKTLFVDYNQDMQLDLVGSGSFWLLAALILVPLGFVSAVRRWRRAPAKPATAPLYQRLVALLKRHGGPVPSAAQTPLEYAAAARDFLQSTAARALAALPAETVHLLYRARFAGQALTVEESQALHSRINEMAHLLKTRK